MTASSYADYVKELRAVLADLVSQPDRYQTFSLHVELVMESNLLVYETGKRKGQTDTIAYFRAPSGDRPVAPDGATSASRLSWPCRITSPCRAIR